MTNKPPSPYTIQQVVGAYQRARAWLLDDPDAHYDEAILEDILGPETGEATELLDRTLRAALRAKRMADACDVELAALKARKERFARRFDVMRMTSLSILGALERRNYELPELTAGVRKGPQSVVISDEAKVEERFMRVIPARKEPDKALLREALTKEFVTADGEVLQGEPLDYAHMSNGAPYLVINAK